MGHHSRTPPNHPHHQLGRSFLANHTPKRAVVFLVLSLKKNSQTRGTSKGEPPNQREADTGFPAVNPQPCGSGTALRQRIPTPGWVFRGCHSLFLRRGRGGGGGGGGPAKLLWGGTRQVALFVWLPFQQSRNPKNKLVCQTTNKSLSLKKGTRQKGGFPLGFHPTNKTHVQYNCPQKTNNTPIRGNELSCQIRERLKMVAFWLFAHLNQPQQVTVSKAHTQVNTDAPFIKTDKMDLEESEEHTISKTVVVLFHEWWKKGNLKIGHFQAHEYHCMCMLTMHTFIQFTIQMVKQLPMNPMLSLTEARDGKDNNQGCVCVCHCCSPSVAVRECCKWGNSLMATNIASPAK